MYQIHLSDAKICHLCAFGRWGEMRENEEVIRQQADSAILIFAFCFLHCIMG